MTTSIAMLVDTAERMANIVNSVKEMMYIVRRPTVSENELHHSGNIDMASMYTATLMFAMVVDEPNVMEISFNAGMAIAEPIGAAIAQKATMVVINHFVFRA